MDNTAAILDKEVLDAYNNAIVDGNLLKHQQKEVEEITGMLTALHFNIKKGRLDLSNPKVMEAVKEIIDIARGGLRKVRKKDKPIKFIIENVEDEFKRFYKKYPVNY